MYYSVLCLKFTEKPQTSIRTKLYARILRITSMQKKYKYSGVPKQNKKLVGGQVARARRLSL